jgi:hypothetical protein
MAIEEQVTACLKAVCVRTYPDVAPETVGKPYLVWQCLGGKPLRYLENTPADKRHTYLQVKSWALTRADATALIRQVEDALCASATFTATPEGEPLSDYESETKLYASIQRFSILSTR